MSHDTGSSLPLQDDTAAGHSWTLEDTEASVKRCEQHLQRAATDDASPNGDPPSARGSLTSTACGFSTACGRRSSGPVEAPQPQKI